MLTQMGLNYCPTFSMGAELFFQLLQWGLNYFFQSGLNCCPTFSMGAELFLKAVATLYHCLQEIPPPNLTQSNLAQPPIPNPIWLLLPSHTDQPSPFISIMISKTFSVAFCVIVQLLLPQRSSSPFVFRRFS